MDVSGSARVGRTVNWRCAPCEALPATLDQSLAFEAVRLMQDVVIDTNVLVAALRSRRGASYQLVRLIGQGFWRVNISVALALEYEDVLKRENMLVGVSKTDVDDLLDYLFKSSELRRSVLRLRPSLRDADDERILELAVHCRAMIITHNKRDFVGSERFGISLKNPSEFLRILREGQ
jgi:putative PIN family toxin of toxin-antitoxin system